MPNQTASQPVQINFHLKEQAVKTSVPALAKAKRNIGELLRFALTTAVLFALFFGALNFSAYKKQAEFWYSGINAEALANTDLPEILQTSVSQPEPATTATAAEPTTNLTEAKDFEAEKLVSSYEPKQTHQTQKSFAHLNLRVIPPENRLAIPRLGINAPIRETEGIDLTQAWETIEKQIQKTLENGVAHFPGTADPGTRGNAFLTGHSSYYPWAPGRYKDIFAILPEIEIGDQIIIFYDQQKYVYEVSGKYEVSPKQVSVLEKTNDERLTLMTCIPVGTSLRRLIVTAHLAPEKQNLISQN
jgi:LPXTG-site transpeptidase (sortase) family protein